MSGGVDSSVTAALLVEQGHDVTGVYMKNWSQDLPGFACPWKEDYQDARRVAVQLDIPFKMYDFETEYRSKVVDYMVAEYQAGRTPNPDIMCNQEVKFKLFLNTALNDGADMIATGHYSRTEGDRLRIAANSVKDQSYFLYRITADAISKTLMPIGGYATKDEVRAIATDRGLATATKKDSQGICFVGKVGIKDFLLTELGPQKPGPIVDHADRTIGEHDGALFYTIGQRHGLDIGGGLPYYVARKDMATNTVYVTTDLNDATLWSTELTVHDQHWINQPPEPGRTYQARLRYRGPLVDCTIDGDRIVLADEQRGLAAGQSAVIYDGEYVLGGAILNL